MTGKKIDGDFTACDTALLNRFFRDYNAAHTRGGTNTKQRNLRHLFTCPATSLDSESPACSTASRRTPSRSRACSKGSGRGL